MNETLFPYPIKQNYTHYKRQQTTFEKGNKTIGLEEDALNRARWRVEVGEIAVGVG